MCYQKKENLVFEALQSIKEKADDIVMQSSKIMDNESYFDKTMIRLVIDQLKNKHKFQINAEASKYINKLVVDEYINEYNGVYKW